ncbi:alpha/beta hydrolase [Tenacibaculum jejuense]|uniref:Phospholipase/carboxylesterase n=1 Tax=Tenacibaculum jejuense TaxID=584609 RepID=A0A238UBH7_9FLAO|nr:alpha/beta fold hydrolase [Tenacibaculum jejuense]SNR16442.1 Phospholipase/carboxylesterase [Tenacibaculum jejuense]
MSLFYKERAPKVAPENPNVLILLHGYGSNEDDLFSFAEELSDELLIITVRAPYEMGYGGYAWYAINFDANNDKFSDTKQASESVDKIAAFIDEIKAKYNTNKTFLLGFSQGAILSYGLSLRYPNKVQHVVALSGYLLEDLIPKEISADITTDYYVSHGIVDQVIPFAWAKKTPDFLNKLNLQNEFHEYPVGHGVAPQNFYSFKDWIDKRL